MIIQLLFGGVDVPNDLPYARSVSARNRHVVFFFVSLVNCGENCESPTIGCRA
jgi:hypothetical protein